MQRRAWSAPTSWDEVCRRASGRRRFNQQRWAARFWRQTRVERLLRELGERRGVQRLIAARLGVAPSTICGDVRRIRAWEQWRRERG